MHIRAFVCINVLCTVVIGSALCSASPATASNRIGLAQETHSRAETEASFAVLPTLHFAQYLDMASATGIALDRAGNQYIVGTNSSNNPSDEQGYVLKLSATTHRILYRVHVPGAISAIAVDPEGAAYAVGTTTSTRLPVVHAVQPRRGARATHFFLHWIGKVASGSAPM